MDAVKAYGEAKIQLHLPFTSALNGGDKINSTEIMKFFIVASDLCGQEYRTGSSDSAGWSVRASYRTRPGGPPSFVWSGYRMLYLCTPSGPSRPVLG